MSKSTYFFARNKFHSAFLLQFLPLTQYPSVAVQDGYWWWYRSEDTQKA